MKCRKKIGAMVISVCLLFSMFFVETHAASGSVSISSKTGSVGSQVTVSCTVKCSSGPIGYADVTLKYDASALQFVSATNMAQGGSGSVRYVGTTSDGTASSLSFSMKFKILKEGSHRISTTTVDASDIDESRFTPSGASGTITGKAPTTPQEDTRDKNNKLKSLELSVGTLEPVFDSNVTTYTVVVPEDTTDVSITAIAQSNKAQVVVSGGTALRLGSNTASIVVTAENGDVLTYILTIMCGEAEKIHVNGMEHTINYGFTDDQIPVGFSRTTVIYNKREYEAVANANNSIQLVSLQNSEASSFYIYKQETQQFYPFTQVNFMDGKYIVPLPLNEEIEQFKENEKTVILYSNQQLDAWKLDDEFSVVCAMNQDGEELLYRYDSVDGVFQRYVETVEETTIFPGEYYMYAIVALGTLSIILFIAMIYFIASRKARHEGRKRKAIKRMEKQKAKDEKKRLREEAELERIREEERIAQEKQRAKEEKQRTKEEKKLAKKNKKNRDE